MAGPRIALVHAVHAAMAPVAEAFRQHWPEAVLHNLVDDRLAPDIEQAGSLTPELYKRIHALARLGMDAGAAGVLFTCTAFADAIEKVAAQAAVPVLKPEDAMFDQALRSGRRIGMVATFAPAVAIMESAFRRQAERAGSAATLETVCVPAAMVAARAGDIESHNRLVVEALPKLAHCEAIMLAQFSTSTALAAARAATALQVLSAPEAAVLALRRATEARR